MEHAPELLTVAVFGMLAATIGETQTSTPAGKPAADHQVVAPSKAVLYAAVGAELTQYDVDVAGTALVKGRVGCVESTLANDFSC
jgi:hypothetical protein